MTVAPGKAGIGVFSPRLDFAGNSVRGQLVTAYLSRVLGLNISLLPHTHLSVSANKVLIVVGVGSKAGWLSVGLSIPQPLDTHCQIIDLTMLCWKTHLVSGDPGSISGRFSGG